MRSRPRMGAGDSCSTSTELRPSKTDPADVYIGTDNGKSVRRLFTHNPLAIFGRRSLRGLLQAAGYVVSPARQGILETPEVDGGFTTQTYGSSHADGLEAMQLEIAHPIRESVPRRRSFHRTSGASDRDPHRSTALNRSVLRPPRARMSWRLTRNLSAANASIHPCCCEALLSVCLSPSGHPLSLHSRIPRQGGR